MSLAERGVTIVRKISSSIFQVTTFNLCQTDNGNVFAAFVIFIDNDITPTYSLTLSQKSTYLWVLRVMISYEFHKNAGLIKGTRKEKTR